MHRISNLSNDFINRIIELSAGRIPQNQLEDFFSLLEYEIRKYYFTKSSESNLLRILQSQFDLSFLIKECIKYPHQLEILISVANNSNYLSDILVRNPEYFFWVVNPSVFNQPIDKDYYSISLKNILSAYKSFDAKVNALRNFKRKEILRIGLKDFYAGNDLSQITCLLSYLAVSISTELFKLCYDEILKKYDIKKTANKYVLISLGKLGGNELNYSSDIDLIAFYDKDSLINKKIYYKQILSETILLFIETAGQKTGKGFLYRIDFRLRPDGRNAPLCGSYSEYLKYYEMRGEDWERQMLIKANFLCGNKKLYQEFIDYLARFIFPSTFLFSPIEQIKKLKTSIEKRISEEDNIKLSPGGIRDIEFSIQALQLINGGKDHEIRSGNTLTAISILCLKKIISEEENKILKNSYILFRKIEHFLQLMNDQQTHLIPADGEIAEKLSHYLGFNNLKSFRSSVAQTRNDVKVFFDSVFGKENQITKSEGINNLSLSDPKRAKQNLTYLQTGKSILEKKQFDLRTINAFEKLEPDLLKYLSSSTDPDLVLENFIRIIKSAHYPLIWYEEFFDKKFFNLFLNLCEFSQKTINLFAEDKFLRDEFLSRQCLTPLNKININNLGLKSFLFRSSVQISIGLIDNKDFTNLFSSFLTYKIRITAEDFASGKEWKDKFFIAAMGSFGNEEVSFNSDLDLIFLIEDINKYQNVQKDFQSLLKLLREALPFLQIDCRLRPEGKSSLLVWDVEDYKKYFNNRARIWELQAFTKCRIIFGNKNIFDDFYNHYIKRVRQLEAENIKKELSEMRKKLLPISDDAFNLKKSSGGLLDIDFIIGFLLLTNPDLIKSQRNKNILESVKIDHEKFWGAYNSLKKTEIVNQITFDTKISKIPTDEKKLLKLAKVLNYNSTKEFYDHFNFITALIRNYYQNIFK
jgi:glutamate-ammonia-ligase adenylyltransferase